MARVKVWIDIKRRIIRDTKINEEQLALIARVIARNGEQPYSSPSAYANACINVLKQHNNWFGPEATPRASTIFKRMAVKKANNVDATSSVDKQTMTVKVPGGFVNVDAAFFGEEINLDDLDDNIFQGVRPKRYSVERSHREWTTDFVLQRAMALAETVWAYYQGTMLMRESLEKNPKHAYRVESTEFEGMVAKYVRLTYGPYRKGYDESYDPHLGHKAYNSHHYGEHEDHDPQISMRAYAFMLRHPEELRKVGIIPRNSNGTPRKTPKPVKVVIPQVVEEGKEEKPKVKKPTVVKKKAV